MTADPASRSRPSRPSSRPLRVDVTGDRGRAVRAPGLAAWLLRVAPPSARGVVAVALASDARVRELNRRYRGKNRVTDVLSFPAGDGPASGFPTPGRRSPPSDSPPLGDIVIAMGQARRQARVARHPLATELRILALHGLLHLLGHDHERDDGRMGRLERALRRKGGLPAAGLIERGGRRPSPRRSGRR